MKKIILISLLFITIFSFSQEDDRLRFYRIDGSEYLIKEKEPITIQFFLDNYLPEYKYTYSYTKSATYNSKTKKGILSIYFMEFTDKPIFILGNKPSKNEINQSLSAFNYNEYRKSWEFNYHLKQYIKEESLIIDDLYKTFGKPDEKRETSSITVFEYNKLHLNFTINNNGKVIDFLSY